MAMTANDHQPDEAEALLPWAATGRLDPKQRALVADALEARADLKLQMALIAEDRQATVALNESLGAPSSAAWDRIASVVDSAPRRASFWSRAFAFAGRSSLWRLAAVAALIIILVESAAIVDLLAAIDDGSFQTAAAPVFGALAFVEFAPQTRVDEMDAWLGAVNGVIVEGPKSGLYKIRFGDAPMDKAERDALLQRLRASPIVKSASPAKN